MINVYFTKVQDKCSVSCSCFPCFLDTCTYSHKNYNGNNLLKSDLFYFAFCKCMKTANKCFLILQMFNNVFCKCDPDWFICYASFLWHIVMKITTNTLYKSNLICIWCCVYIIWEGNKKVKCVFMLDFHSSEPVKVLVWKTFIS